MSKPKSEKKKSNTDKVGRLKGEVKRQAEVRNRQEVNTRQTRPRGKSKNRQGNLAEHCKRQCGREPMDVDLNIYVYCGVNE